MRRKRVYRPRPTGIPDDSDAPYWQGERAEQIVAARQKQEKIRKLGISLNRLKDPKKIKRVKNELAKLWADR